MALKYQKKVLVIFPFQNWPLSQGAIVRIHYLIKYLGQYNKIWFAFRGGQGQTAEKDTYVSLPNAAHRYCQLFNPPFLLKLWRTMRTEKIDAIIVSHIWSTWHGILLHWLTGKPFIFDNHNVEYLRFRRMGHLLWPLMAIMEFFACHTADHIICVSERDKAILTRHFRLPAAKIQVAANGADVTHMQAQVVETGDIKRQIGLEPEAAMVLFFGSLNHPPNAQAADIILDEIAPRLAAFSGRLRFVLAGLGDGKYLQARQRPLPANVLFTGFVDDITALIKSADLVIVPILSGSGTRFKIIESAACGRPIISTTIGAEGLDRAAFGDLLTICDDWDDFAQQIKWHLAQPRPYDVPAAFRAAYDWQHIFESIDWSILDG